MRQIRKLLTNVVTDCDYILLLILAVSFLIRYIQATLPSFSTDEINTYLASRLSLGNTMQVICHWDRHPPLYYIFLHYLSSLGSSETVLRLPSILLASLSVFIIYHITLLLTARKSTSRIAAILAAFFYSFWHLDSAVRMFSAAECFTLAGTYFFIRMLILRDMRAAVHVFYVISMLLGLYCLYFSALIFICHLVVLYILDRGNKRLWLTALVVMIFSTPIAFLLSSQTSSVNKEPFSYAFSLFLNLGTFYTCFVGLIPFLQSLLHKTPVDSLFIYLSMALTIAAFLWEAKALNNLKREAGEKARFLSIMFWGYMILLLLATAGLHLFNIRDRYFFLLYPFLTILTAIGIDFIGRKHVKNALIGLILFMNCFIFTRYNIDPYMWEYCYKPFAETIKSQAKQEDMLLFYVLPSHMCLFNYYYAREEMLLVRYQGEIYITEPVSDSYRRSGKVQQHLIRSLEDLEKNSESFRSRDTCWLLMSNLPMPGLDRHPEICRIVNKYFDVKACTSVKTIQGTWGEEVNTLFRLTPRPVSGNDHLQQASPITGGDEHFSSSADRFQAP